MLITKLKNIITAIDKLFSTKHDLLAIGLFMGASIALMLSELFNWSLNKYVGSAISTDGFWFALISFFVLFLKLLCIAFVLFGIDRLYNRFVRRHKVNNDGSLASEQTQVKQEVVDSIAIEEAIEHSVNNADVDVDSELKLNVSKTDIKSSFITEYLREDSDKSAIDTQEKIQDSLPLKYQKKEQLRLELEALLEDDSTLDFDDSTLDILEPEIEHFDFVEMLSQDFSETFSATELAMTELATTELAMTEIPNSKFLKAQEEDFSTIPTTHITDLSPEKIRSVLAKN